MAKRRKKDEGGAGEGWLATFADMLCLLLCFFAILFNPVTEEDTLSAIADYFANMGWGYSLTIGRMQETGNTLSMLPSATTGRALADAYRRAIALFNPVQNSNNVRVTQDERGLIISFASDMFFESASARINQELARGTLLNLAILLNSSEVGNRRFRIEGHTDAVNVDGIVWESNWQLASQRSLNVLYYLASLGVSEYRAQVSSFGHTMPLASEDTEEGRAFNRRVDIVIIDDGHL